MRGDRDRLLDIVEAIERIERHASSGRESFDSDELVQAWMVYHLQILGEAARSVSEEFRKNHAGVPWREMVAMRNVLAHGYFGIDVEKVWAAVQNDLPPLKAQIEAVLGEWGSAE